MVRMRPCVGGAQAPHWFPLCSCYCRHCSCAVSGQSRKASSFSLSLTFYHYLTLSLAAFGFVSPDISILVCFLHLVPPSVFISALFHYFISLLTYVLQPSVTSVSLLFLSVSPDFELQAFAHCNFPHLSLSVSGIFISTDI